MEFAEVAIEIPGYIATEQLYIGSKTIVYRGQRQSDATPVVIKLLRSEHPRFSELVQFRNQYTIAKTLNLPGIIKPYSLECYRNGYALVMEDFGGVSLVQYVQGLKQGVGMRDARSSVRIRSPLPVSEFLTIALQLADILNGLYAGRVIHRDLKPANILINPVTQQVKLIDFSIASLLPRETQDIQSPNILEGTLAYLSPEQTGRMNRDIDYRSDFYSLGVTFFELLTGRLPFESTDPMEMIHSHIAKQPPTVHHVNPAIPIALSDIVGKLMAKNAEDRYQSVSGLKRDLEHCLLQWKTHQQIEPFKIGQWDVCDRFVIPEKLYGRDVEIATLLAAFDRAAGRTKDGGRKEKNGKMSQEAFPSPLSSLLPPPSSLIPPPAELLLIAGFSGIGKTAVVNEVHKPIARQRGYFIKGKFDQFQRNIPFFAFVQAFQELMGQLLGETDAQLAQWKARILEALGDSGQVIVDVIPELELIIGQQAAVAELSGSAAQNRFNTLFQRFIQVFTAKEHPLVIFIDDLQWADSASLKLMQLLTSEQTSSYLLIIGAYRDNEVTSTHPLMMTLEKIRSTGAIVNTVTLAPLQLADFSGLIADALHCSLTMAEPLARLVHQKTGGNPFFGGQFLKALQEDGLIWLNQDQGYWQYDIEQIEALALSDNVVDFMVGQLQKLPGKTQTALRLAACIGNQFDSATLAVVLEMTQSEVAARLWEALQEGLILPLDNTYKAFQEQYCVGEIETQDVLVVYRFLHDRVQQAAYSLIPEPERQMVHRTIGRLLLEKTPAAALEEALFDIVNHLNIGADAIHVESERSRLIDLNLQAARKAKASTAYEAAVAYLTMGRQLLTERHWQADYELAMALYLEFAECAYLCGQYDQSDAASDYALVNAQTKLDRAKIYDLKIILYMHLNQVQRVIEAGRQALRLFNWELPKTQRQVKTAAAEKFQQLQQALQGYGVDRLLELPDLTDLETQVMMDLLKDLIIPASHADENLFQLLIFQMMHLSLQYGNSVAGVSAYCWYGVILGAVLGEYAAGHQYGELALKLAEKFNQAQLACKVHFIVGTYIAPWKTHVRTTIPYLVNAYEYGLESGDLFWAGYAVFFIVIRMLSQGVALNDIKQEIQKYLDFMQKKSDRGTVINLLFVQQFILNLQGLTQSKYSFNSDSFDEVALLEELKQISPPDLHHCYCYQVYVYYLRGDYAAALRVATIADREIRSVLVGDLPVAELCFYYALTLTALYLGATNSEQQRYWRMLRKQQRQLQQWSDSCPENFLHKYWLVSAEIARISGKSYQAMELYDRAISSARQEGFVQNEAIANELAAKFYLAWGKENIAQAYLTDAYYCYARWGAKAKVDDLETAYFQLLASVMHPTVSTLHPNETLVLNSTSSVHSTSLSTGLTLDLATVLKASQALSSEIQLEKLLATLLQVVIESAGADKCVLSLVKGSRLVVEAIARVGQSSIVLQSIPVEESREVPLTLINLVKRNLQVVVLAEAVTHPTLAVDPYLLRQQPKSVLASPILQQGKLVGILYLENNLTAGAFTSDRVEVLNLLCAQAAISLENARLYQQSNDYAQQLEQAVQDLQHAQLQLVQSEKMSALGNLVAGVAHEINNPVGFIRGNLGPAREYVDDLFGLIERYRTAFPAPGQAIEDEIAAIDLAYMREDLPKLLDSMQLGIERIRNISNSLRTFSRADTDYKVPFNIHEGIDSTLLILKHRLKAVDDRPAIDVVRQYGSIPEIECFPGQLNQVFMNLLANAIDALEEANRERSSAAIQANPNRIVIKTALKDNHSVIIQITDNGAGMTEATKQRIFDHLFTTKSVGKGTGLGLAIARQIVVENHQGTIEVQSIAGHGTEFAITLPIHVS